MAYRTKEDQPNNDFIFFAIKGKVDEEPYLEITKPD